MNKKPFRTAKDILKTLAMLDFDLNKFKLKSKIELLIFGGTALLLKTNLHVTGDIDAVIRMDREDKEVRKLLAKYTINDKMVGVMELPPMEDIYEKVTRLNIDFNNIIVLLPSTEHLILSKLFTSRQTDKDIDDIIKSGIIDQANVDNLRELYAEYISYTALPTFRYNDINDVLEKWEIHKRKEE